MFWGLLGRDIARQLQLAEVGEGWFYAERGGLTWLALGVSAGIRVCGCLMMWWVIPPRRCRVLLRCLCWAYCVFVGPSVSSLVHSIHGVLDGVGPQPPQFHGQPYHPSSESASRSVLWSFLMNSTFCRLFSASVYIWGHTEVIKDISKFISKEGAIPPWACP